MLSIITFGIYFIYWHYKINEEIGAHDTEIRVNPIVSAIAISLGFFIIIPPFLSAYNTAERIKRMQVNCNSGETISPILAFLLYLIFFIGYPLYIQSQLNTHWRFHEKAVKAGESGGAQSVEA